MKAKPFIRDYVECTIGRDSLKMRGIYYDNYYRHNKYYYRNLAIYAYLLFDEELNIKEVRMASHRQEDERANEFQVDLCHDLAEFLKTTQWIKKDEFPEPSPYSHTIIYFLGNDAIFSWYGHYLIPSVTALPAPTDDIYTAAMRTFLTTCVCHKK